MSKKTRQQQRHQAKLRAQKRQRRRQTRLEQKAKVHLRKQALNNIGYQLQEQFQPTFDKSSFQALQPPRDTCVNKPEIRVLRPASKTKTEIEAVGFDRGGWNQR